MTDVKKQNETSDSTNKDSKDSKKEKDRKKKLDSPKWKIIEDYIRRKYYFRNNVVTGKFEYSLISNSNKWAPINKLVRNSIRRTINESEKELWCSSDALECIIESDFSFEVNPLKEYFLSLPKITGTSNIDKLLSTIEVEDREKWFEYMTKWLVAVVANLMDDNRCCNHTCLVLVGGQGVGKTTWLNGLCPESLKREYLYVGKFDPDNKDSMRLVSERLFINIDDQLNNINRSDEDKIKAILTQVKVSYRKPYDVNVEDYPHRASFMGSVNSMEYLTDNTGSRRFISFEVQSISLEEQKKVNMDLVYAECMNLYKTGFYYWFEGEEIRKLENHNKSFMVNSHEYELLTQLFRIADKDELHRCTPMTTTQIHCYMEEKCNDKLDFIKVGKALKRLVRENGLVNKSFRLNGNSQHGYCLFKNKDFNLN